MKKILMMAAMLASGFCQAEVYKCTVEGKTVFSDQECKGAVVVKIASAPPVPVLKSGDPDSYAEIDKRVTKRLILEDIERNNLRINELRYDLEAELAKMRDRKSGGSRNVKDALDKNTIAVDMTNVSDDYKRRIEFVESENKKLRWKLDQVK